MSKKKLSFEEFKNLIFGLNTVLVGPYIDFTDHSKLNCTHYCAYLHYGLAKKKIHFSDLSLYMNVVKFDKHVYLYIDDIDGSTLVIGYYLENKK